MRMFNLAALLGMGLGVSLASPASFGIPSPQKARKKSKQFPSYTPHPAMPATGWPKSRQVLRAESRAIAKRFR